MSADRDREPLIPSVEHKAEGGTSVLYLGGPWRLANLSSICAALEHLGLRAKKHFVLDGSRLQELDTSAGFALFRCLADLGCTEDMVTLRAFTDEHKRLLALVHERMTSPAASVPWLRRGIVQRVGAATIHVARILKSDIGFLGAVVLDVLGLVLKPRMFRVKETTSQFEAVCIDAIPIVVLVTFLIGVVFAYLLGIQAQRYGANIFVVDGVGLAICRELSPILVAVIMAGRSGAAFTAHLGTMKVQEETDAIRTLGLSPIHVLVVPRLFAIVIAMPLLTFVGDVSGIAGGMAVAAWQLDIGSATFVERLHAVLPMRAFVVGLAKAPVFAAFIALIACHMGLTVTRDARSVGIHTTSTVVQSIVWVILLDALFAVLLQHLGI